jgi:hypothetical protein
MFVAHNDPSSNWGMDMNSNGVPMTDRQDKDHRVKVMNSSYPVFTSILTHNVVQVETNIHLLGNDKCTPNHLTHETI